MYSESLLVHFQRVESLRKEAIDLPSLNLKTRQLCDLELLLNRGFFPLKGFLGRADYESVLAGMRLASGELWPMPVCLDVDQSLAEKLSPGSRLALRDQEGFLLAVLTVTDVWQPDLHQEAEKVYGTSDPLAHPSVRFLLGRAGKWYVGGTLEGMSLPMHFDFQELRLAPYEMHRRFTLNGWRRIIGFQCEQPLHCAHKEMISKAAREVGASILLHPVVGVRYQGDLDQYTLVRTYQAFVRQFPRHIISLGLLPLYQRKAGPREALLQALVRRNYGCTHFLVAEDQADPFTENGSPFYPRGAAQKLVRDHEMESGIAMIPLREMVYVEERAEYLPTDEVAQDMNVRTISSQELRRRLEHGVDIPTWFSFPEVVEELRRAYPQRSKQGITIFFTGLSGAGKSTVARVLLARFLEMRDRPVTLLDGDIVRRNLSSELSFSKEHRELNVRRIGFVASEITKNGGIAICAPIAPYPEARDYNRRLISQYGGFVEVYMSTPLDVCEQRDRKGLYAKARAGLVKGVTGIDDPYIPPINPEVTIDTSQMMPLEAAQVILLYLEEQGYIR
ncbi:MAG: bifunctional sulfate adenylyltransferase/adenylylsulfate kinase [Desulfovibrionales bacterium]|nr:bifunctional sulfate adenylyltransferase/adenylylsulfate kinase [Desulfovibrionales bacterium]